jgi:hypothetical protein
MLYLNLPIKSSFFLIVNPSVRRDLQSPPHHSRGSLFSSTSHCSFFVSDNFPGRGCRFPVICLPDPPRRSLIERLSKSGTRNTRSDQINCWAQGHIMTFLLDLSAYLAVRSVVQLRRRDRQCIPHQHQLVMSVFLSVCALVRAESGTGVECRLRPV